MLLTMSTKLQASKAKGADSDISWQARCAMLSLLAFYLEASADVQRQAVRKWSPVAALFGLLWEEQTQQLALTMVGELLTILHERLPCALALRACT